MDISKLLNKNLISLKPYVAVEPPSFLADLSGLNENKIIKLNANENPYGASPKLQGALNAYQSYHIYPDSKQMVARKALAEYVGISEDCILVGAGADEIIDLILRATLEKGNSVINCPPTFGMYSFGTHINGGNLVEVPRDDNFDIDLARVKESISANTKVIFLTSPNNPTGNSVSDDVVLSLLEENIIVVVDETYFEFSGKTVVKLVEQHPNLVVLRTFSKWAGLAGLRVGYGIMSSFLVNFLMDIKNPYNLNVAAEVALLTSLDDLSYLRGNLDIIIKERERLFHSFLNIAGILPHPSEANFLLCDFAEGVSTKIYEGLARMGIFVRYFDTPVLKDSLRISVGTPKQNDILISAISDILIK